MNLIPVFLNLKGKKILIIGGGKIALRKAKYFENSEADITIISPEFDEELQKSNHLLIKRKASESDICNDFSLVVLATNSEITNKTLAEKAESLGILFNTVDQSFENRFNTCSRIDKYPLHIGIVSSGAPTVSQIVKSEILPLIDDSIIEFANLAIEIRQKLKRSTLNEDERKAIFKNFFSANKLLEVKKTGISKLREEIESCLSC